MKKILLPLLLAVLALSSSAQLKSGYVPFHQTLLSSHGDIQKHNGNSRSVVFEEISYMHYIPNSGTTGWTYSDSGQFSFGQTANATYETGGMYFQFANVKWDTLAAFTTTSNSIGLPLTITGQNYNETTATFTNSYQYTNAYNGINYLQTQNLKTWRSGAWADSTQFDYTYGSGNFDSIVTFQFGSPLQNDTQFLYTYNGYSNTQTITQVWNGSAWINLYKESNSFDANGNNYQSFVTKWDGSNWVNYGLIIRGYDLNNELVSYVSELWNSTSGTYVNSYQEAYAYVLGNNTQFENYNWDTNLSTWVPNVLNTYSYDQFHNVIYESDQQYISGAFTNSDQYYYHYQQFQVSGIQSVSNALNMGLFPNPASGNTTVSFVSENASTVLLNVYDVQGNLLKQERSATHAGNNQLTVNLSVYAAGNYLVQVVDGNTGKTGVLRLVKQ